MSYSPWQEESVIFHHDVWWLLRFCFFLFMFDFYITELPSIPSSLKSRVFNYEWVLSFITCFFCILWVDCMFFSYSFCQCRDSFCQSNNGDWISDAKLNLHNWIELGLYVFTYGVGFNLLVLHVGYLHPMLMRDVGLWLFFLETSL